MTEPTLVLMAAGMGSRVGGLKQVAPVDRAGHPILAFSLYDAWRAGFRRVVFVIKRELETEFRERVGRHAEERFQVFYVFQDLDRLPAGFQVPVGRVKPWGTGHAVACCQGMVTGPFAVINADDFYGPSAFSAVYSYLIANAVDNRYAMVGYRLRNTVTEHGSVSRGICQVRDGFLSGITERTELYKRGDHAAYTEDGKTFVDLPGDTLVSMNLWGFSAAFLEELWASCHRWSTPSWRTAVPPCRSCPVRKAGTALPIKRIWIPYGRLSSAWSGKGPIRKHCGDETAPHTT